MSNIERLTIALPKEMLLAVNEAIELGDYASVSEVVRDALRNWKYQRALLTKESEEIKLGIQQGLEDLKIGKVKSADEVLAQLENKYLNLNKQ
jgi:antitoxin ParD1/3/4